MTLSEPVTVNIGPQHPSTHGVLRLRVTFDGEVIVDLEQYSATSIAGRRSLPKKERTLKSSR